MAISQSVSVLHLTEGADGASHCDDLLVPLDAISVAPPAPSMPVSAVETATGLLYLILPAGWGGAMHSSPRRQVAFCPPGRVRVEAGDGGIREFGKGAIWRMKDVAGSGHTTTGLGDEDVLLAILQLPPQPGDPVKETH